MYIEEIKSHLSSDRPLSQALDKEPSTQSAVSHFDTHLHFSFSCFP